jgi:hypothetical protein
MQQATREMMHANIDPGNQIVLRNILSIEEFMEVNRRGSWQVHVPHAARGWFCLLATGDSQIVTRPVRVLQEPLRTDNGLSPELSLSRDPSITYAHCGLENSLDGWRIPLEFPIYWSPRG